jgi:acyl-CoA reductase-like NAD-dependent aldehyde dehydrogenase
VPSSRFTPGPRTTILARVGGITRWSRTTPDERKVALAKTRDAINQRYLAEARAMWAEIAPQLVVTDEQLEKTAKQLHKAELLKRLASGLSDYTDPMQALREAAER